MARINYQPPFYLCVSESRDLATFMVNQYTIREVQVATIGPQDTLEVFYENVDRCFFHLSPMLLFSLFVAIVKEKT